MSLVRGDWFYVMLLVVDAFFMTRPYLYAIQQDNYRIREIFKNKRLRFVYLIDLVAVVVFVGIWCIFYFFKTRAFWGFLTVLFFFIAEFAMYFMEDLPTRKKPLKYTKRAVRCLVFVSVFSAGAITAAFSFGSAHIGEAYFRYLVLFAFPIVYPALFILATGIINIFEKLNNYRYERRTAKRLSANENLVKVAITGSYGKTTVKNFLTAMLSQKYNVLASPASYNTPMGIAKTANSLDATHDIFVAEFGARRVGDIKKLMKIVKPTHTILTGINSQHLETFKTQENIVREKCRVLNVGNGGVCVVNSAFEEEVDEHFEGVKDKPTVIYAGFDLNLPFKIENVRMNEDGSEFKIILDGRVYEAYTQIIGYQNLENIILAATMAYALGVTAEQILCAIGHLEPVPHRMQLIRGNGIKIIDDSFNSNPDGAQAALDTLEMFNGRKVVLTPGMVELGSREKEENFKLGLNIGKVADLVLLVGAVRTDSIRRGLNESEFKGEIHVYDKLSSAEDDFQNRLRVGDVLLILNDLPDIYDEKS